MFVVVKASPSACKMPRRCCVPNCRGNYDDASNRTVFRFPKDSARKRLWLRKIDLHRDDFEPNHDSVVCIDHFDEQFIVRVDCATRPDGSILRVERKVPKLTDDAYPSKLPGCSSYLTEEVAAKRQEHEDRRAEIQERDDRAFTEWMQRDKVKDFSDFGDKCVPRLEDSKSDWSHRLHKGSSSDSKVYWSFYKIADSTDTKPSLVAAVRVFSDLHVEIFTDKVGKYT